MVAPKKGYVHWDKGVWTVEHKTCRIQAREQKKALQLCPEHVQLDKQD